MTQTMEDLAEQADNAVRELRRVPSLDMVRAALNECGIRKARSAMRDAPDILANAQETLRSTQAVEAAAKEAYDTALAEASWVADSQFVSDKNRTYLRRRCPNAPHVLTEDERAERFRMLTMCALCDDSDTQSFQMTAEQRRAWVAAEAAKQPAVTMVAAALGNAAAETAASRDAVEVARLRVSVCRHEVDAAVAELEALVVGIPR